MCQLRRVAEGKENDITTVVNELVKGPNQNSLLSDFNPGVKLIIARREYYVKL